MNMSINTLMGMSVKNAFKVKITDKPYERIIAKAWANYLEGKILEVVNRYR